MRDKISALMDGELDNKDMKDTITQIEELEELQNKWRAYHLIGDALREPVISKLNVTSDIRNTMGMEPDVLTPALSNKGNKGKFFLFAAAASIFVTVTVKLNIWKYIVLKAKFLKNIYLNLIQK